MATATSLSLIKPRISKSTFIFHPSVLLLILIGSLTLFENCDGAKILFYVVPGSYSMLQVYHPYAVKLTERGHEVTLLSGHRYKNPHPNITYIVPEQVAKDVQDKAKFIGKTALEGREKNYGSFQLRADSLDGGWSTFPARGLKSCKSLLTDPKILKWINSPETHFDLVIIHNLWTDCGIGLAYKFKCPHILFETCSILSWTYDTFGLPPQDSVLSDIRRLGMELGGMTFLQRVRNALDILEMYFLYRQIGYLSNVDELLRTALNMPNMPSVKELEKNVSLVLVNAHFTMESARSLPPLFVEIGGLQCVDIENPELPQEISVFVEKYPSFVLVSFGTLFQLNWEKQKIFLDAFKQFPEVAFVFRWNGEMPSKEQLPENVLTTLWAPQTQLLAHKKIAAFISHGGMMSSQESIFYAVPMIVMPGFTDQDYNAQCLKRLGVAIKLEIVDVTVDQLAHGVRELLTNPSYKENMKKISSLRRDLPQHPMDTAIWWTEYVLRNTAKGNGLDHLKPLGINQYWFQRRMIDVWLFLAGVSIVLFSLTVIVLVKIVRYVLSFGKSKKNNLKRKTK